MLLHNVRRDLDEAQATCWQEYLQGLAHAFSSFLLGQLLWNQRRDARKRLQLNWRSTKGAPKSPTKTAEPTCTRRPQRHGCGRCSVKTPAKRSSRSRWKTSSIDWRRPSLNDSGD